MPDDSNAPSLGDEVKRLRTAAGWTQKKLHEMSGLSQAYIAQIESGARTTITADTLFQLCGAFKVDCNHFSRYFKTPPAPAAEPATKAAKGKRK